MPAAASTANAGQSGAKCPSAPTTKLPYRPQHWRAVNAAPNGVVTNDTATTTATSATSAGSGQLPATTVATTPPAKPSADPGALPILGMTRHSTRDGDTRHRTTAEFT
nr:hypothetical protein GCM10017745_88380 [Saccharothrix mutabilis subsp. capreolus]